MATNKTNYLKSLKDCGSALANILDIIEEVFKKPSNKI